MNIHEMLDAVKDLPEGDYVECGVWKGFMAEKIYAGMNQDSWLWLFDTFAGHNEPSEFDDPKYHPKGRYSDTDELDIQRKFPNAKIVMGPVETTLRLLEHHPNEAHRKFRFVHLDMDHYLPTKAACEFFKPRMVKGGIIRFDDYRFGECPGATKAVDEVFGPENILPEDYRWICA